MNSIGDIVSQLNTLTPVAVIGLLGIVIFLMVKGNQQVEKIKNNDLHTVEEKLDRLLEVSHRIEVTLSWVEAKIGGGRTYDAK